MDPHMENLSEHEMAGETVNLHDEKQGHEDDLEVAVGEKRWPGWPGDSVFRILVPSHKIGGIIGRKGEFIKKMCEESKARIKIVDGPQSAPERAVIISAKEEQDALISPAMDGLLRVHKRVVDGLDGEANHAPQSVGNKVPTRLLVASTQAGTLIGKQGATIRSIQESSNASVRILDDLPPVALQDDRIVEIQGEPAAMHKALELIAAHLRKFLVDHSVLPLFETPMSVPHQPHQQHMEQNMAPPQQQHWGPAANAGGGGYGGNPQFMPPRPHDNFYPPYEKPPHHGISTYGRDAPQMGGHLSANQQPPQMVSKVTNHMQIPLAYADAVIGAAGASISYIRRSSGATITIQETRGVPGEMTVEINGSATQVQTAQQLIQNFMAGAGAPSQPQQSQAQQSHHSMGLRPADQSYGSYASHGAMYGSPGSAGPALYGSGYGNNYGY